jgi:hypothetical protein
VCKCVLPPGDNTIAVNKYINIKEVGQMDAMDVGFGAGFVSEHG